MGVRSSKFSAVILNAYFLAASTAEIFNTIKLGIENGGQSNGRPSDHTDQPQRVS